MLLMQCTFSGLEETDCPSPIYPATTLALHASAHFHTLISAFCLPLRLHFPYLLLTVSDGVSEGTVTYVLWANWRPTEIITICVHCRPGQSETQSHVTICVSLSTTCVNVLKKIQKSVHVPGAICLTHRYSYFAPYVNITKYSSWTVKNS